MGIKGLMPLLKGNCPAAIREGKDVEAYADKVVAIDASILMYQFMSAIRGGPGGDVLVNPATGETVSHILGMFNRVCSLLAANVKPVFVFDGAAPVEKQGELMKRAESIQRNEENLAEAIEKGDAEDIARLNKRIIRVSSNHFDDCRQLFKLMGVPFVNAPCEAEAQCAELVKSGLAFATATEDMDALTFGSERLLRSFSGQKGQVVEIHLPTILRDLHLDMQQFVDLCVLCGCDYTETIKGLGSKTALKLIQEHKTMKDVLKYLQGTRLQHNEEEFQWEKAIEMFVSPDVIIGSDVQLEWKPVDEKALTKWLVDGKGLATGRVALALSKIKKSRDAVKARKQFASMMGFASKRKPDDFEECEAPTSKKSKETVELD